MTLCSRNSASPNGDPDIVKGYIRTPFVLVVDKLKGLQWVISDATESTGVSSKGIVRGLRRF